MPDDVPFKERIGQIVYMAVDLSMNPDIDGLVDLRNEVEIAIDQLERQMEREANGE